MRKLFFFIFMLTFFLVPSLSTTTVSAAEPNTNLASNINWNKPTKVWIKAVGDSSKTHIFFTDAKTGYRGWLTRMNNTSPAGLYTNFEGYIYRPDLPYPQPMSIPIQQEEFKLFTID